MKILNDIQSISLITVKMISESVVSFMPWEYCTETMSHLKLSLNEFILKELQFLPHSASATHLKLINYLHSGVLCAHIHIYIAHINLTYFQYINVHIYLKIINNFHIYKKALITCYHGECASFNKKTLRQKKILRPTALT